MRIAIAADHNGVALKARLVEVLRAGGHVVDDRGAHGHDVVDYPPLCEDVCRRVVAGSVDRAIVVGGSGLGEVVACNKIRGIRAGLCPDVWHAEISRGNNDANVLVLGAKAIDTERAEQVLEELLRSAVDQKILDRAPRLEDVFTADTRDVVA